MHDARHPSNLDGTTDDDQLLDRLLAEIVDCCRAGQQPDIGEYCRRHPALAADLRSLAPAIVRLESLRPGAAEPVSLEPLAGPGQPHFGDFQLLAEIGRGGMGIVYEALQTSLKRRVALKLLSPRMMQSPRLVQRFHREALATAQLHHTNIVPLLSVGEHEGRHFLVMQRIDGFPLDRVLAALRHLPAGSHSACDNELFSVADALVTRKGLAYGNLADSRSRSSLTAESCTSVPQVGPATNDSDSTQAKGDPQILGSMYWHNIALVGLQVAEALDHAERQGVLHRDIKPSNILLDRQGIVWITDFGLAKVVDDVELTNSGELVGTLRYLPPERLSGDSDIRGDVYSLGATLYELATLRPPFDIDRQAALLHQIVEVNPPRPRAVVRHIPRDLDTIISKAMAKNPADRYPTAAALADDLRRLVQHQPIQARRLSAAEQAWRWCRRNPAVASLSAIAALLLLAITAGSIYAARRLQDENLASRAAELRAVESEHARREELFRAELAQAQQVVATGGPGQRFLGLQAVRSAMNAVPISALPPDRKQELVDAAVACLTRPDVREVFQVDPGVGRLRQAAVDPQFERFAYGLANDRGTFVGWLASGGVGQHFPGEADVSSNLEGVRDFSRDGRLLAETLQLANSSAGQRLRVLDLETGKVRLNIRSMTTGTRIDFSPDGRHLVAGSLDGIIRIYDLETGSELRSSTSKFRGPIPFYNPQGDRLLVVGGSAESLIVDPQSWQIETVVGTARNAHCAAWNPRHTELAAIGLADGRLYLWNNRERTGEFLSGRHDASVITMRFSPDGELLASSTLSETRIRQLGAEEDLLTVPGILLGFAASGRKVATYHGDRILVRELITPPSFQQLAHPCACVEFSPDGQLLAASGQLGVQLLSTARLARIADLRLDQSGPVAFQPDGKELLTYGIFSHVWTWPLDNSAGLRIGPARPLAGSRLLPLRPGLVQPEHSGRQAQFSRVDRTIFFIDNRNDRVMKAEAIGKPPREFAKFTNLRQIAASSDGRWLAAGTHFYRQARVWDADSGLTVLDIPNDFRVAFSSDSRWLATRSLQEINIYQAGNWEKARTIECPAPNDLDAVALAFQPGSSLLAVNDSDCIRLYDVQSGELVLNLPFPDSGGSRWLAFSANGRLIAAARPDRDVLLWDLVHLQRELAELGIETKQLAPDDAHEARSLNGPVVVDRGTLPAAEEWCQFWRALAQSEAWQRRWRDAVHDMTLALAQEPPPQGKARAELLDQRGDYYLRNGEFEQARTDWKEALALNPRSVDALRHLVRLYVTGPPESGSIPELRALLPQLESFDSSSEQTRMLTAIGEIRLGNFAKGLELVAAAQPTENWQALALYFSSLAHHGLNDDARARELLAQAVAAQTARQAALGEEARAELDRLRGEVEGKLQ